MANKLFTPEYAFEAPTCSFSELSLFDFLSDVETARFCYTKETYNNPQNLWAFACVFLCGILFSFFGCSDVLSFVQCEAVVQVLGVVDGAVSRGMSVCT